LLAVLALTLAGGCAAFRAKVTDVDVEKDRHLQSTYDYSDMRNVTQGLVDEILGSDFLSKQPKPPVMTVVGIENRTKQYVDTKALSDRMRTLLFQSGKMQFVNPERREDLVKEQAHQAQNATAETRVAAARQTGAKYMISGSLIEMEKETPRQVRVSKTQINYYKLTVEVTDLESGLITWTTEKEFARSARLPLIGW
jgi:uncharacterized protein (TIGR02722 family)